MYIRAASLAESLSSLAHHFLSVENKPYKLQPGGPGYELTYATTAVVPYLQSLAPSGSIDDAFSLIADHEQILISPILNYLTSAEAQERGVRVVGSESVDLNRVPTISFVVSGERKVSSKDVVSYFDKKGKVYITLFLPLLGA